jgi:hypothetical protein
MNLLTGKKKMSPRDTLRNLGGILGIGGAIVKADATSTVDNYKFPSREQHYTQSEIRNPIIPESFLLMYATFYMKPDKAGKHSPAHYLDTADAVNARFAESKVWFSANKITAAHHHDGEDAGEILASDPRFGLAATFFYAHVVNSILGPKTGFDYAQFIPLLTNSGKLLLDPVVKYYKPFIRPSHQDPVTPEGIVTRLDKAYDNLSVSYQRLNYFYSRLMGRWENVRETVQAHSKLSGREAYLTREEADYLQDTLSEFLTRLQETRKDREIMGTINEKINMELEALRGILQGPLVEFDRRLLFPTQSPTMQDALFTVYGNYLKGIFNGAVEQSREFVRTGAEYDKDHPRIAAAEIKPVDQRDVVSRLALGGKPEHKISVGYKAKMGIEEGHGTVRILKSERLPHERLEHLVSFHHSTTIEEVNREAREARSKADGSQTRFEDEASKLEYLRDLIPKKSSWHNLSRAGLLGF